MTPLPKNKITRAERGKRRAGNTPSLTKDINKAKVPLSKGTFMAKLDTLITKSKRSGKPANQTQDLAEKMSASRGENKKSAKETPKAKSTKAPTSK
ncbi:MAG: hypothetical protein LBG64_04190 [Pseudomonadales bacterium]|jgi:hypothetical protein|nr:hypothetical protein [Pseudomonadales bacterium]